jgi:hypothetical protein
LDKLSDLVEGLYLRRTEPQRHQLRIDGLQWILRRCGGSCGCRDLCRYCCWRPGRNRLRSERDCGGSPCRGGQCDERPSWGWLKGGSRGRRRSNCGRSHSRRTSCAGHAGGGLRRQAEHRKVHPLKLQGSQVLGLRRGCDRRRREAIASFGLLAPLGTMSSRRGRTRKIVSYLVVPVEQPIRKLCQAGNVHGRSPYFPAYTLKSLGTSAARPKTLAPRI